MGFAIAILFGLHSMTEYPLWYAPSLFAFVVAVALLPEPKPLLSMSFGAGFKKIFFASALAIFIWIYVDQMAGFDRFMRFHLSNHESMSVEEKSWWFSPYDDYIELQQIQLNAINIAQHQHQIINLTIDGLNEYCWVT